MSRCLLGMAPIRQLRFCIDSTRNYDLSDTVFLVDQFDYRTALTRSGLSGRVNYTERNLTEKWFHTLKMRIDRFHNSWVGSRASAREWFEQFVTTTARDRTKLSTERRRSRRCRTRQYQLAGSVEIF